VILRADGLTKRFDRIVAVDGLDLEVREGEVFGFLGPNGAGKTTTLRLLCTLIAPTAGTAEIAGYRLRRDDARIRAVVGILTEQPGHYERLSAQANLDYYGRLYGLDPATRQQKIERLLRLMGLWDRRSDPIATFSRGMKQKVAIARAALHEPRILFLDEPTTGLDPDAAKTVRDLIVALREEGRTVFLCTHNLDEADRLCDRIALFRHRLLRVDTPGNLRREVYGAWTEVRLRQALPEHLARVRAVPGVRDASLNDSTLRVDLDDPLLTNPAIVRTLVDAGAEVAFVTEGRPSLEDVYLKIMESSR
jgi:ABC-2 type transport system ATP-binding protein